MNSIERVFAAVEGKSTDRPAVTLTLSLYGSKLTGCPSEEYYTNPQAFADGQTAVLEEFHPDILFSPFALAAEGEAFGSQIAYLKNNAPNISRPVATSVEEVIKLNIPDIDSHPRLQFIRESVRLLSAKHGDSTPIAGITMSPVDLPAVIMGIDAWLETLLFDKEGTKRVIEITSQFFVKWANTLLSDGANVLVLPCDFSNPRIVTENILKEIATPVFKETFSEIKGPIIIHNGGARIVPFIKHYDMLPNVAAVLLDSRDSISKARDEVNPTRLLMGNIDGPNLYRKSPERIHKECEKILTDRQDDHHFILASSSADVAYETPKENIHAMIRAAKDFK